MAKMLSDVSSWRYGAAYHFQVVGVRPKLDGEGRQQASREGVLKWEVGVLRFGGDDIESMSVGIYAPTAPDVPPMTSVTFDDLKIGHYDIQNGPSGLWYSATGVRAAASSGGGKPAKPAGGASDA